MKISILEIILPSISLVMFILYHLWFIFNLIKKPEKISLSTNIKIRKKWSFKVLTYPDPLIAVQSFRNEVTSNGLQLNALGVSAFFIVSQAITSEANGDKFKAIKFYCIFICCVVSMVIKLMAARDENNLLFFLQVNEKGIKLYKKFKKLNLDPQINNDNLKKVKRIKEKMEEEKIESEEDYKRVLFISKKLVIWSSVDLWISYRSIFLAVMFAGWVFGPIYCISISALVVIAMYLYDTSTISKGFI